MPAAKWEDIPPQQVKDLARKQWTNIEIAAHFEVHVQTLTHHFSQILEQGRLEGIGNMRDDLWQRAKRSDKLFIELLNRYLGPVPRIIKQISELTDEQYIEEGRRRLNLTNSIKLIQTAEPIADKSEPSL